VRNWLTRGNHDIRLDERLVMLFGNPQLFSSEVFHSVVGLCESAGVFIRGRFGNVPISFTYPLFGAPAVSMYLEVAADLGVRKVVACGYVGGLDARMQVGDYFVPSAALAFDGCTRAYFPTRHRFSPSTELAEELKKHSETTRARAHGGPLASIDALMLESDEMIEDLGCESCVGVDLETACFFAIGDKLGLTVAALHIVSDNPRRKDIDEESRHEGSFPEQIRIALEVLSSDSR
jgi:purine-nucleoside phosphorylase